MALISSAVMAIFNDFDGDPADHDDWHSYEHMHERLSIPGFLRGSRWASTGGWRRFMVFYEVSGVEVAASDAYLARLNAPTPWTSAVMPRFRGMTRGFCHVEAAAGYGLGREAVVLRFTPEPGREQALSRLVAAEIVPALATRRGVTAACLLRPTPPPPMTAEQALRGGDARLPWLLVATGYDAEAVDRAAADHFAPGVLAGRGAADAALDRYSLQFTATAAEVGRTPRPHDIAPEARAGNGPRL